MYDLHGSRAAPDRHHPPPHTDGDTTLRQIEVDADTYDAARQAVLDQLADGWIVTAYRVDRPLPRPKISAVDVDDIIARYRAGASMLSLADQHHTSRHTIRRILHAAGEPTRPTGRPRLDVSSDTIADLYEAGTSFGEISTRLGIHPDAARTRYHEVRSQRGLTRRGLWHQVLLDALDQQPLIAVLPTAADHLGRQPTRNEAHAARRAARDLARAGDAALDHQLLTWQNRRCPYLVLTAVEDDPICQRRRPAAAVVARRRDRVNTLAAACFRVH